LYYGYNRRCLSRLFLAGIGKWRYQLGNERDAGNIIANCYRRYYRFLLQETSLPSNDIIMLLSLYGDLAICQTVNPNKTVRMSIPLRYAKSIGYQAP
jgi:acetamidase/formamidase